jgi:hypothetical protein
VNHVNRTDHCRFEAHQCCRASAQADRGRKDRASKAGQLLPDRTRAPLHVVAARRLCGLPRLDTAIVSSVTRDGIVKEVRLADGRTLKRRDWAYCHVDSKGMIADPAGVCAALREPADKAPARLAIEYQDRGEANAAIKTAARIEQ